MHGLFDSLTSLPHLGETLSVLSALIWAFAIIVFRVVGQRVHALGMNLFKSALGASLFALTLVVSGESFLPALPGHHYLLLFLSGLLGIAVADTLLFIALNKLGAELTAIVDCVYVPFVIGLSILFLGERINPVQSAGVGFIVLAVFLITRQKSEALISRRALMAGIGAGVLSMFFSAAGIVLMKPVLNHASLIWASFFRLASGAVFVGLTIAVRPERRAIVKPLRSLKNVRLLVPASFLASYLSLVIWMGGMKFTQASIAAALNQMSTIFIFILAAVFLKERITPLKLAAVVLAFAGAILVAIPF
jgi:drug/metabolite transporter (DMT)-like permease